MKKSRILVMTVCFICLFVGFSVPGEVEARGKDFIVSVSMAMYPEFSEGHAFNAVVNHLYGRTLTDPALKDKHNMKLYDKGMLYPNQDEHLQAISRGALQMTYSGPHFLETFNAAWKLGEAPGVFGNYNHFLKTMGTPAWQALHKEMAEKHNVTILGWLCDIGVWYLFTDKGPVNKLDDIKGKKIRYAGGEAFARALRALGTTPISLPYTEVVTGLQTHMIDGLVTDFTGGADYYELHRYTPNTVLVPFTIQPMCIVADTKWWVSLGKDAQESIRAVLDVMDVNQFYAKMENSKIQKWKDDPKLTVVEPGKAEIDKWQALMRESIKDMISGVDPKYMEAVQSIKD